MEKLNMKIHVAMITDDKYVQHLSVTVCSILKNLSPEKDLCLYVFFNKLSDFNKKKIFTLKDIRPFSIKFFPIDVETEGLKNLNYAKISGISKAGRCKLMITEVLRSLDKCLYLDSDIIACSDISKLWDIAIPDGFLFGAIEEPVARIRNCFLGIDDSYSHFNSGVILFDIDKIQAVDFFSQIKSYLMTEGVGEIVRGDQDTLNAIFYDKWYALPMEWNVVSSMLHTPEKDYYKYKCEEIRSALNSPSIIHYTEPKEKPWLLTSQHPFKNEYLHYKKLTIWKNSLPKKINFFTLVLKIYQIIRLEIKKFPVVFRFVRAIKRVLTGWYLGKLIRALTAHRGFSEK